MSWIQSILALVNSDELATDVAGAEALLDRHQVCLLQMFMFGLLISVGMLLVIVLFYLELCLILFG